ncbi:MAG: RNA polymerase factor sigma-54 [Proteobacteria bacterium]|nr:RNA polymerase factor sigma-54 [Pseudomonadota bacterium]HQR04519.1 RNA polymerase factor sigma-54 [Rhodocyclaceae bacterium]
MKQTLQIKLSPHLALTPQLQQSIRLLQLSTLELNQEIEQFLHDNPLLEREEQGDDGATFVPTQEHQTTTPDPETIPEPFTTHEADPVWEDAIPYGNGNRDPDDDSDAGTIQAATTSLRDHLLHQLALTQLASRDRALVCFLIEALDEDGYLAQALDDLLDLLPQECGDSDEEKLEELQIALRHLQSLDPPGVGARNPRECLDLQLCNLVPGPEHGLALLIVRDHLDHLATRDFARIKKSLNCSDTELRDAHALIRSLNPRPGAIFAAPDTRYVVPDVMVRKLRGTWTVSLNGEAMPRLRINRLYAQILRQNRGSGLTSQLQEAKWLIKNVQQRFDTIQRVSQAIVDRQIAFFDHGEVAMRPLTLREIADTLDLHESTISRVTTQKYLASPRGIHELKYFFGSHVATDSGGAASSTAIRALIRQLISAEDGKKPLSDSRIAEILGDQGIVVARRTVAKYRESVNIPPVNLRKTL